MTGHDVIVIGGSLAGAACVRELERLGVDAIAYERDRFPRSKVCGGFLSPGAVECLGRLALLESVVAAGAVEVNEARIRVDEREVTIPFRRSGLGISRQTLDAILARGARVQENRRVCKVAPKGDGFEVDGVRASIVIDAAGKLSRFTRRKSVDEFGVQYTVSGARGAILDFWFFEAGYGGGVSIEGDRSNFCFLIRKDALQDHLPPAGGLVTGPLAFDKLPGDFIAIGDAAGMVDPFCGEGMHHALDTGMLAAQIVARGLRRRAAYQEMKREYEAERERRWARRRAVAAAARRLLKHRRLLGFALECVPKSLSTFLPL